MFGLSALSFLASAAGRKVAIYGGIALAVAAFAFGLYRAGARGANRANERRSPSGRAQNTPEDHRCASC